MTIKKFDAGNGDTLILFPSGKQLVLTNRVVAVKGNFTETQISAMGDSTVWESQVYSDIPSAVQTLADVKEALSDEGAAWLLEVVEDKNSRNDN